MHPVTCNFCWFGTKEEIGISVVQQRYLLLPLIWFYIKCMKREHQQGCLLTHLHWSTLSISSISQTEEQLRATCLHSWAWGDMVMCVQWISGSIRESHLVGLLQIRQAEQIQAAGWSSGALTHIAPICTSLPIMPTIGCHISWASRDLHTLPCSRGLAPHNLMLSYANLGYPVAWLQEVLDESQWGIAATALGPDCAFGKFGMVAECWPWY